MNELDKYLSLSIRVQAAREGLTMQDVRKEAGISSSQFTELMGNRKSWTASQIDNVAKALHLANGIELYDIAKYEYTLAHNHAKAA